MGAALLTASPLPLVLPLGWLLAEGSLPNSTIMISGALFTRSWEGLAAARDLCRTRGGTRRQDVAACHELLRRCPAITAIAANESLDGELTG